MTDLHPADGIRILVGDVRERLAGLPAESVHCVVTSPPYWGLRDYGTGEWEGGDETCDHDQRRRERDPDSKSATDQGAARDSLAGRGVCRKCGAGRVDSQLGLEPTPEEYVENLVAVFREVRRVLRPDGTVWLNLGDSYAGGGGFSPTAPSTATSKSGRHGSIGGLKQGGVPVTPGLKPKDLCGIPWRVAFALQADGWWLRSDIVWSKPNPMPESVTDRPTKAHEYLFLLAKSERYFFDQEAVREPWSENSHGGLTPTPGRKAEALGEGGAHTSLGINGGRNIRSVWTVATEPSPGGALRHIPDGACGAVREGGDVGAGVLPGMRGTVGTGRG